MEGPALIGKSEFAPTGLPVEFPNHATRLAHEGETVGWWIPEGESWSGDEHTEWPEVEVEGMILRGAFDLVTALEHFLVADVADFISEPGDELPDASIILGDPSEVVLLGAMVEPGVTFDVRKGAIVIEQNAYVRGGTRLAGPLYVGPGTEISGGFVTNSAIGPACRIGGEVNTTVWLGNSNKAHYGFVGHSVIGNWVNLGAGTTTSNLKNTYGEVRISAGEETIETSRQFLGSLIGDHAKLAIGTLLNTGTIIGAGANVFGANGPAKYVPPFAWGDTGETMRKDAFITTAERVMARRNQKVDDEVRGMLSSIYDFLTR